MSLSLRTIELDYDLPERLIATRPVEPRDAARMLVVSRSDPSRPVEHRHVRDLPEYLKSGDAMVFNTSAVARARLSGRRAVTGGRVEGLFLEEVPSSRWLVMLKSNGRLHPGDRIELVDAQDRSTDAHLELIEKLGSEWLASVEPNTATIPLLERIGRTPLPPYILKARGTGGDIADEMDRAWYETVYANPGQRRSVAAPTAGLHFTSQLLAALDERGIRRLHVALHVGAGTFRPVMAESLDQHEMHSEAYEVPWETIRALQNRTGRVFAVGTTAVRTLESLPHDLSMEQDVIAGTTDLMITPGYHFRHVDGLLTNFHLPRSTLLALVAAMLGLDRLKAIYQEAIDQEYRFYSYGDCMLILP